MCLSSTGVSSRCWYRVLDNMSWTRRRQKLLRSQLDTLRERRAVLRPEGDGEDASWRLGIDDESEREAWLAQLELDSIHVSAPMLS